MTRKRWREIATSAALSLFAALSIAARPGSPMQDGEVLIRGVVFHDVNGNQRKDARERGLANVSVISQASDAQGGAVNASTVTSADGSFMIQSRPGNRISVVPGAGYKAMQPSGIVVREDLQEVTFPLYVDKVVVDRVIRMEPATVTMPAPQVYVSPQITVPAPVVNIQPANVHIAPAEVVVQPAPVHVAPAIDPATLWVAVAAISLSSLIGAGLIGSAMRAHARTLYDVAAFEMSRSACCWRVDSENWKGIAEQVIADTTLRAISVEGLLSISTQPVPAMHFRATNSQVFVFSLGRTVDETGFGAARSKRMAGAQNLVAAIELRALWSFFANGMYLPSQLPRTGVWHVAIVSTSRSCADSRAASVSSTLLRVHPQVLSARSNAIESSTQICRNHSDSICDCSIDPQVMHATQNTEAISDHDFTEERA